MKIEETALDGVLVLTPNVYRDDRGAFLETWNLRSITEAGLPSTWVQDNYSLSKKNVLRGLHYQVIQPQGKLVRVTHGAVLDVAVDLRRSSPNFGKHVAIQLDEDSGRMLWIPIGFGHAFLAVTAVAGFAYKVTDYYAPGGSEPSCGMIRNWQSSGQLSRVMRSCRRRTRTARPFGMPRSLHEQRPAHTHFRFHCLAHGGFSDHAHPPCNHELSRLCQCSFVRTGSLEFWHGSAGKLLGQELGNNGVPQGPGVPVNRKIVLLSIR